MITSHITGTPYLRPNQTGITPTTTRYGKPYPPPFRWTNHVSCIQGYLCPSVLGNYYRYEY